MHPLDFRLEMNLKTGWGFSYHAVWASEAGTVCPLGIRQKTTLTLKGSLIYCGAAWDFEGAWPVHPKSLVVCCPQHGGPIWPAGGREALTLHHDRHRAAVHLYHALPRLEGE